MARDKANFPASRSDTSISEAASRAMPDALTSIGSDLDARRTRLVAILDEIAPHVIAGVDSEAIDSDLCDEWGLPR